MKLSEVKRGAGPQFANSRDLIDTAMNDLYAAGWGRVPSYQINMHSVSVTIMGNLEVDRYEGVNLPVKFETITGDITIKNCPNLESLEGLPPICYGNMKIYNCPKLKNLKGASGFVGKTLDVEKCDKLTTLDGCPLHIATENQGIIIQHCKSLKSIKGMPIKMYEVGISNCPALTSLEGLPETLEKLSLVNCVGLKTLEHAPKYLDGMHLAGLKLDSLRGCPTIDQNLFIESSVINSMIGVNEMIPRIGNSFLVSPNVTVLHGGLGLILIDGLEKIAGPDEQQLQGPFEILSRYVGQDEKIFECQNELIDAGFETYADL